MEKAEKQWKITNHWTTWILYKGIYNPLTVSTQRAVYSLLHTFSNYYTDLYLLQWRTLHLDWHLTSSFSLFLRFFIALYHLTFWRRQKASAIYADDWFMKIRFLEQKEVIIKNKFVQIHFGHSEIHPEWPEILLIFQDTFLRSPPVRNVIKTWLKFSTVTELWIC